MEYLMKYSSPVGLLYLASGGAEITGLWMEGQRYFAAGLGEFPRESSSLPVFRQAVDWLDAYFAGQTLPSLPPLAPKGSAFRQSVWEHLLKIPCGQTRTYGELARDLGSSPRAIGGAVGHNPISILIPCHRVVGADGNLTGYAGGVDRKRFLLELERDSLKRWGKAVCYPRASHRGGCADLKECLEPGPGKFPCPCCGCKTFPVPKEDALAYICPVCFWENDVFDPGDDQPSDENRGMTLRQGREVYRRLGAVCPDLIPYVRKPLPEELP